MRNSFLPSGIWTKKKSCQRALNAERSNLFFSKKCQATRDASWRSSLSLRRVFFPLNLEFTRHPQKKAENVMWSSISLSCQNLFRQLNSKSNEELKAKSRAREWKIFKVVRVGNKNYQPRKCVFKSESQSNQTNRRQRYFFFLEPYTQRFLLRNIFLCMPVYELVCWGRFACSALPASECETRNLYVTQSVLSLAHT